MSDKATRTERTALSAAAGFWAQARSAPPAGSPAGGGWLLAPKWAHAAGSDQDGHRHRHHRRRSRRRATPTGRWRSSRSSRSTRRAASLGRPIELYLEDTASDPKIAVGNVRKLIQERKVDVVLGGITAAMRQAIKDPIVNRGRTLYIYPQLYEGQECTKNLFCTGPNAGAAVRQADPLPDQDGGQEAFRHAVGQLCLAAASQQIRPQGHRGQRRRGRVRGVLSARPAGIFRDHRQDPRRQGRLACSTPSSRPACSRS